MFDFFWGFSMGVFRVWVCVSGLVSMEVLISQVKRIWCDESRRGRRRVEWSPVSFSLFTVSESYCPRETSYFSGPHRQHLAPHVPGSSRTCPHRLVLVYCSHCRGAVTDHQLLVVPIASWSGTMGRRIQRNGKKTNRENSIIIKSFTNKKGTIIVLMNWI